MVSFTKLLSPALFAFLFTSTSSATSTFKPTTHRTHYIGPHKNVKLNAYHPEPIFTPFGVDGVDALPGYRRYPRDTPDLVGDAVSFLASKLDISEDEIHVKSSAQGQAGFHVYLAQMINGVPVANAVANVAFNNDGKVSSFSSSFVKISGAADINPSVPQDEAISTAQRALDGTYNEIPIRLEFIVQADSFAALTYVIQIENMSSGTMYAAFIDAHRDTLLSVTDFVRKSSYLVLPIHKQVPAQGFETIVDPQNLKASPNGWHQEFTSVSNVTAGNNCIAYNGSQIAVTPFQTSATLNFIYAADLTQDPTTTTNTYAGIVNGFYVVNTYHDFAYIYGFTEATFNMQTNNFNIAGQGFDRVLVSVHDMHADMGENLLGQGVNFTILPDGQSSKMELFLFVGFNPSRDSVLQNDILIHESQHGANNRMTGGGSADCYSTAESVAVDEGYADAMADVLSQTSKDTVDFVFGKGVNKDVGGLRKYPYSLNNATNPLLYSHLKTITDVYDMGSFWGNTLHQLYGMLVALLGWSATMLTDASTIEGNVVFAHLVFDAQLLQPCNPTILQARDALIQADANRYKGAHECVLWLAFSSKGLGVNAANYLDDFVFPTKCPC